MNVLEITRAWTSDSVMPTLSLTKNILQKGLLLSKLEEAFDTTSVVALVTVLIRGFCQNFNVAKNMTNDQCENFAIELVVEEGKKWSLEELTIFFDRAASGRYGKPVFDHVDKQVIEQMMDDYFATDRTDAVHSIHDDRDNEYKPLGKGIERTSQPMGLSEIKDKYNPPTISNVVIPGINDNTKIYKDGNTDQGNNQGR